MTMPMRLAVLLLSMSAVSAAQDSNRVAGVHHHLAFENACARGTRVTYDGGIMQFGHVTGEHGAGFSIDRRPVKAGAIRFAHGAPETHTVEYLGDESSEYVRIELRTEAKDRPTRDVRLPPMALDASKSAVETQFEGAM